MAGKTEKADPNVTVQNTHGLVSTNEWTGVPLRFLIDLVGKDRRSTWMLAEGADRSRPLIGVFRHRRDHGRAFIDTAKTASRCGRPTAFRSRLITPGLEGNLNIKWLRRLKIGTSPG